MIRRSDLTPQQIRLMTKLDDGSDQIDSVGEEIGQLRPIEVMDVRLLVRLGLVMVDEGHGGQVWARLTEKGRKVHEEGRA